MSADRRQDRATGAPSDGRRPAAARILAWTAAAALAGLSLTPGSMIASGVMTGGDRHAAAYAVAAVLARLAWPRRAWTTAAALIALALALEALQALSPGREPSFADAAAGVGGTLLGALLAAGGLAAAAAAGAASRPAPSHAADAARNCNGPRARDGR